MNTRGLTTAITILLLAGGHFAAAADPVRVLSCEIPFNRQAISNLAAEISVEMPDIILAQGVRNWNTCRTLAQALEPAGYAVLTCSGFGAVDQARYPREVAIISRHRGYYAWTERAGTNHPASGFAFAAVEVGSEKIGVISLQLGKATQNAQVIESVIDQVGTVNAWETNRPSSYVLMCSGVFGIARLAPPAKRLLAQRGFLAAENLGSNRLAYAQTPGSFKVVRPIGTNVSILLAVLDSTARPVLAATRPAAKKKAGAGSAASKSAKGSASFAMKSKTVQETSPQTAGSSSTGIAAKTGPSAAGTSAIALAPARPGRNGISPSGYVLIGGVAAILLSFGIWLGLRLRPRARRPTLLIPKDFAEGPYVVVTPRSTTTGSDSTVPVVSSCVLQGDDPDRTRAESLKPVMRRGVPDADATKRGLVEWLKNEFVRRLIRDRSALMEQHREAETQAESAGRRLASLEERLVLQNEAYQTRIEELTRELGAAREENRELIRMRIAQVKSDMEAARARLLNEE